MKPQLKAPVIKRLKPYHVKLLSKSASKFSSRRYTMGKDQEESMMEEVFGARAYTRSFPAQLEPRLTHTHNTLQSLHTPNTPLTRATQPQSTPPIT